MRTLLDITMLATIMFTTFWLGWIAHTPEPLIVYERIMPLPTPKTHIAPTKDENQVVVTWIKDKETVALALSDYEETHGIEIRGYAEIWEGYCNVYAHDFDVLESKQGRTFLHEVTHCFKGEFHP